MPVITGSTGGSYFYPGLQNPISSYPSFVLRNRGSAPSLIDAHGQIYVLSPSNDLYFKSSDGIEFRLTPPGLESGIENYTGGESFAKRDAVYIGLDNRVYRASVFSVSSSFAIGFTLSSSLTDDLIKVEVGQGKIMKDFDGLIAGSRYYLSGSQGKISTSVIFKKSTMVYQVGVAKSSTELLFYPRPIVIL